MLLSYRSKRYLTWQELQPFWYTKFQALITKLEICVAKTHKLQGPRGAMTVDAGKYTCRTTGGQSAP